MKEKIKQLLPMVGALLCLLLSACDSNGTDITVTLVNRSGQPASALYITPATNDEWGDNLLSAPLEDGVMQQIDLGTYNQEDLDAGFNILVYNMDDEPFYDTTLDEQDLTISDKDYIVFLPPNGESELDITAAYDSSKYDGLAADHSVSGNVLDYSGSWKYDSMPTYLFIDDTGSWYTMNLYGEQENSGTVTLDSDIADLYFSDGSYFNSVVLTDGVTMEDADGNVLIYAADTPLLPSPQDALNQSVSFPGGFTNVSVSYAASLMAQADENRGDALRFIPVLGDGTDDCYSSILLAFHPISGYDDSMTQGLGTAQPQLEAMLKEVLSSLYGDQLLETTSVQCSDWGSYYSVTGNFTVNGSVVSPELADSLSGVVELRYYGPTSYVLVSAALAPAHRIDTYAALSQSMLTTCTYTTDWTTAPKPVPKEPAAPSDGSDPGDTNTPYYWYDEDGDIWYWDGEKNKFIGFGDSYYIEDGQYYETNDAGWDPDAWSDPGDYGYDNDWYDDEYYDDWSDPGDTWDDDYYYDDYDDYDDYEYYDDGWGDDF